MHVHWRMQAWKTRVMPRLPWSGPQLWPGDSRRHEPPLTNGLPSQLREQPTGRGHDCLRALDKCATGHKLGQGGVHVPSVQKTNVVSWRVEHH